MSHFGSCARRAIVARALWLAATIAAGCASAASPERRSGQARSSRHVVITAGRLAGDGELIIQADGRRTSRFQYDDRGREPYIRTVLELDARGAPRALHAEGHDQLDAPVDEHLELRDGELAWRSPGERGQARAGEAFYLPLSGPYDAMAILGRALLRAPDRRLPLLPAGEARLGDVSHLEVEVGGRRRDLRRLAIEGLGFSPALVWVDEDGEYFAEVSDWTAVIASGAEALIPRLRAEDERFRERRTARLARELAEEPPAAGLAIRHARLFDPTTRAVTEDATVIVIGDRIVAVGGPDVPVPSGARTIDARKRTLLPGLWDMHVHLHDDDGLLHVAAGVTTVRDMGNEIDALAARVSRFDSGKEVGPRVLRAGLIDGPGPFAAPTGLVVATREEALAAVARFASLGYAQIKLYNSLDPALVPVIAADAHARGLRVSGHLPNGVDATQAIEVGFDEIQHATFMVMNLLPESSVTRAGRRPFMLVAERAAELDLDSPPVRSFLDLLVARHTVLDPTLVAYEGMFVSEPGQLPPMLAPYAERLPAQLLRAARGGGLPALEGERATFRASHAALGKLVKRAWERGVTIVAGTDNVPGLALLRELQLYAATGIPPADVLALATIGAARVMGKEGESGSIAIGKRADLVLIDGDPVRDIGALAHADIVVCRGRIYEPARLYRALGMRPLGSPPR